MTLWDQAAKYMLPTGRPGRISPATKRPATNFDRLFVAMPFPKRAYKRVLCKKTVSGHSVMMNIILTKGPIMIPKIKEIT